MNNIYGFFEIDIHDNKDNVNNFFKFFLDTDEDEELEEFKEIIKDELIAKYGDNIKID